VTTGLVYVGYVSGRGQFPPGEKLTSQIASEQQVPSFPVKAPEI